MSEEKKITVNQLRQLLLKDVNAFVRLHSAYCEQSMVKEAPQTLCLSSFMRFFMVAHKEDLMPKPQEKKEESLIIDPFKDVQKHISKDNKLITLT